MARLTRQRARKQHDDIYRIKGRAGDIRKCIKVVPTIRTFPDDLLVEMISRVAATSSTDLMSLKLSCKAFQHVADDKLVLQRVSLEKFPVVPWDKSRGASSFLDRCMKSGNTELLFRQGMLGFFGNKKQLHDNGIEYIKRAATSGHIGALYVLGMICLCSGNEQRKQEGMELLINHVLKATKSGRRQVRECREKLRAIGSRMWVGNDILIRRPTCCPTPEQHRGKQGWPSDESDGCDEDDQKQCKRCRCDQEVSSFSLAIYGHP